MAAGFPKYIRQRFLQLRRRGVSCQCCERPAAYVVKIELTEGDFRDLDLCATHRTMAGNSTFNLLSNYKIKGINDDPNQDIGPGRRTKKKSRFNAPTVRHGVAEAY